MMGLACRHEFPYRFFNLRHGERYIYCMSAHKQTNVCIPTVMFQLYRISYVVYALELLKDRSTAQEKVKLLYDVACLLKRHSQVYVCVLQSNNIQMIIQASYTCIGKK